MPIQINSYEVPFMTLSRFRMCLSSRFNDMSFTATFVSVCVVTVVHKSNPTQPTAALLAFVHAMTSLRASPSNTHCTSAVAVKDTLTHQPPGCQQPSSPKTC